MNRRSFIKGLFLIPSILSFKLKASSNNNVTFDYGVASGDPTNSNVILWTKVTTMFNSDIKIKWQISSTRDFKNILTSGTALSRSSNDFTVKVDVEVPNNFRGKKIFYRFFFNNTFSDIGITNTLPPNNPNQYNIAFCSCSNHPAGYFNAYKEMAKNDDIDLVLHLGDYIYEYDKNGYATEDSVRFNRVVDPKHEILSLNDYRRRHAQYKSDLDLQLLHKSKPMIAIWDDHEFTNDSWKYGAENHQSNEGFFQSRKANAIKAYLEWMPIRENKSKLKIWRKFEVGNLFQLLMLDTRSIYRDKQLNLEDYFDGNKINKSKYKRDLLVDRKLIGLEQILWIKNNLNKKFKWSIIGQQVLMAQVYLPTIFSDMNKKMLPDYLHKYLKIGGENIPYNTDAWDGYPKERERLFKELKHANSVLVLTGDTHNSWVNNLYDEKDHFIGVEIGTPAISSPNTIDTFGSLTNDIEEGFIKENKNVKWTDGKHKGYTLLRLTKDKSEISFVFVNTVKSKVYEVIDSNKFDVKPNTPII
tara:strand:+ start:1367 stop:2950 length:1584 start_codon:yes stop_codon:yes gene_type:complete